MRGRLLFGAIIAFSTFNVGVSYAVNILVGRLGVEGTRLTINTPWESHRFCVLNPSRVQYLMTFQEVFKVLSAK